MGFFDKMLDAMHLSDDDYYDDDDELYEEDEKEDNKRSIFKRLKEDDDEEEESKPAVREKPARPTSKITPMRSVKRGNGANMELCVIKPTSFEDAREIVETLLSNRSVILNMEGLDLGLAQRIIDVTSGACFAIDGTLQKVSNYIFIVTPAAVDISGDLQGIMDAFDFSGIQTGF